MKFIPRSLAVAALLCLAGQLALAQNTTITASALKMKGAVIASGQVTFTAVDTQGKAIPFVSAGLNSPQAFSCRITAGALSGCSIPDAGLTTPANILYQITISTAGYQYTLQAVPNVSGTSWALDAYAPPAQTTIYSPLLSSYGLAAPTGACPNGSHYVRNNAGGQEYICVAGAWVGPINGGGGSGATIATTTRVIKGDNAGNGVAATPGTDYVLPSGTVATATALAGTPTLCGAGQAPTGILPNGNATGCGASGPVNEVAISTTGCAQGADVNTGYLWGTTTPATDAGPCLTAYLASHVSPNSTLILVQDKGQSSAISGIQGPVGGGWGFRGSGPHGIATVNISACAITTNVAVCTTTPQALVAGQAVLLNGFADTTLNYVSNHTPYLVLSAGLSTTQFEFAVTHANATSGAGFASTLFGTGFFQIAGSNADMIRPGPGGVTDPAGTAPGRGAGMYISNLVLNGNRGVLVAGVCNGNSSYAACQGNTPGDTWFFGVNGRNMQSVYVTNNLFYNLSSYAFYETNSGDIHLVGNNCQQFLDGDTVSPVNADCFHLSGPSEDIFASDNRMVSGDDGIAINSPEGYGGKIQRVEFVNTTFHHSQAAGRIYAGSTLTTATIDNVHIHGCSGDVNNGAWIIGLPDSPHTLTVANAVNNVIIEDCELSGPGTWGYGAIGDNVGKFVSRNNTWIGGTTAKGMWTTATNNLSITDFSSIDDACERNVVGSACTGAFDMLSGAFSGPPTVTGSRIRVSGFHFTDVGVTPGAVANLVAVNVASSFAYNCLYANDTTNIASLSNLPVQLGSVGCSGGVAPNSSVIAGLKVGLIDSWSAQEGAGTSFVNSGMDATNAMTASNVTWTTATGFTGTVATYNGTTSSAVTTAISSTNFDGTTPFSACSWINPSTLAGSDYWMMNDLNSTLAAIPGWGMEMSAANGSMQVYLSNNISTNLIQVNVSRVFTVNALNLSCFSYDGSKTAAGLKLYINGTLRTPNIVANTLTGSIASGLPLYSGCLGAASACNGAYFQGSKGHDHIWNRALSAADITNIYTLPPDAF